MSDRPASDGSSPSRSLTHGGMPPLPGTERLRDPGSPKRVEDFTGVQVDDDRLLAVISPDAPLLALYDQGLHLEGVIWDTPNRRLAFSDIPGRRLMAWYPDGRIEVVIDAAPFFNGNALGADGCLVHCEHLRRGISRSGADGAAELIVWHYQGKRLNTPNDVTVAADGTVWFTDPAFGLMFPRQGCLGTPELDHRSVYRFDPITEDLRRMADFDQPNGLFFSPDGRRLYVSDTSRSIGGPTHEVLAFDVADDGSLSNRRLFCRTDVGVPDGFLVDSRGWLWTTSGTGVHIYDADAKRLGFFPTPNTCANLALGGLDGRRMFIAAETCLLAIDLKAG